MSEFRCIHCGWKGDYVEVWGIQGDDWIDGDCPLTEEKCEDSWCDWHGCGADFIQDDWDNLPEYWKQELKVAEMDKESIEDSSYQWMICKVCSKERDESRIWEMEVTIP